MKFLRLLFILLVGLVLLPACGAGNSQNDWTGDQGFIIAADIDQNLRGLLTARMAAGELEKWKEALFRMAQSLQVEE